MRSFLDTNVLVYLFDRDAPEKRASARRLIEREVTTGLAVLSTQVLQEFYVVVTRKLADPMEPAAAERAVKELAALPIVQTDTTLVLSGIARSRRDGFSLWDALIIEAALVGGCDRLYTEDLQHGRRVEGLTIENPFQGAP
ncbi:MAG: PIN domain-containing protein [Longimicrobiales bacterium]